MILHSLKFLENYLHMLEHNKVMKLDGDTPKLQRKALVHLPETEHHESTKSLDQSTLNIE